VVASNKLKNIEWYTDKKAVADKQPGIYHSFTASLATTLNYIQKDLVPVWLMGTSGFAFRIFVSETMCPSAMSIFDWGKILPEAVEQNGYVCRHVSRLWHESELEQKRREEAHKAIINAINNDIPCIVWDIADSEWGLVVGYNDNKEEYNTFTCRGRESILPYDKLGLNGIKILSVIIPGAKNNCDRNEIINRSLNIAVEHADGKEWNDRPKYQNGFAAFKHWNKVFERWVKVIKKKKIVKIPEPMMFFIKYYAGHHYSARLYGSAYLKNIAGDNQYLVSAANSFSNTALCLKPMWELNPEAKIDPVHTLETFGRNVLDAGLSEKKGIRYIKEYLSIK
jgi:hypothetical protein